VEVGVVVVVAEVVGVVDAVVVAVELVVAVVVVVGVVVVVVAVVVVVGVVGGKGYDSISFHILQRYPQNSEQLVRLRPPCTEGTHSLNSQRLYECWRRGTRHQNKDNGNQHTGVLSAWM
jgi:hypothetical protein